MLRTLFATIIFTHLHILPLTAYLRKFGLDFLLVIDSERWEITKITKRKGRSTMNVVDMVYKSVLSKQAQYYV